MSPVFYCERCESRFNATVAAAAGDCPRCKESDGVASKLRFRLFEPSALKVAGISPSRKAAVPRSQPAK
jgi:Zn finger protein HypA/HybF involved in hydrogenase expression